jgi:hypothetical protein
VTRPAAPENPRSRPGHSPAIAARNAAATRAAAAPPIAPAVPGVIPHEKMSYEQKRFAQDQIAARRGGR